MFPLQFLNTPQGRTIAYRQSVGQGPGVVFLGGFKSDMDGTKAAFLHHWAVSQDRSFLRLDYSGHGASSGEFLDGCIGDWFQDARAAIEALTSGPQVIVGSSMGGWISLLLSRVMPDRFAGLVTIAAAPDFTEDSMWAGLSVADQQSLLREGCLALPSEYSDMPYVITRRLIEEGRRNLVLRSPLPLPFPTRFLQGGADVDVPHSVALRLFEHVTGPDIRLSLVKGADHRFSSPDCLAQITAAIEDVSSRIQ